MTYGKLTLISLLTLFLIACGGGGSGSVQQPDPIDVVIPEIVSITPADGASPVSVLTDIEITLSEPVTEASVTETGMTLALATSRLNGPSAVAFERSLSADGKTLTLSPYRPLLTSATYQVVISEGLKHSTGGTVAESSTTFSTFENRRTRETQYKDADLTIIDGYIDYLANGSTLEYLDFGNDGEWFTADDVLSFETRIELNNNGQKQYSKRYRWDSTSTPSLQRYEEFQYNANNQVSVRITYDQWSSNAAGADNVFGTEDDTPANYATFSYENGRQTMQTNYTTSGNDGVWMSGDDEIGSIKFMKYDEFGNHTHTYTFNSPGNDGIWDTNDDSMVSGSYLLYDNYHQLTHAVDVSGKGDDGEYYTADDTVIFYDSWEIEDFVNSAGYWYDEAGSDATWFTSDDVVTAVKSYEYNANRQRTLYHRDSAGNDGQFQTADDSILSVTIEFNAEGNATSDLFTYERPYDSSGNYPPYYSVTDYDTSQ